MAKKSKKVKKAKKAKRPVLSRKITRSKKQKSQSHSTLRYASKPAIQKVAQGHVVPLTGDQVQKFREVLTLKRDELMTIVQRKKEEEIEDMGVGDEADVATRSVEKEMLFELTDSEKQTLDMIEAALRKMEKGIFGACESCQRGIPRLRLQVMPWARYCISCQSEQEVPATE